MQLFSNWKTTKLLTPNKMKNHTCKVKLIANSKQELSDLIQKYKDALSFTNIEHSEPIKCTFNMDNSIVIDHRATVKFNCKMSKNNIYFVNNSIKPNPINFS